MPNPKATSLSDALKAVTSPSSQDPSVSLDDALKAIAAPQDDLASPPVDKTPSSVSVATDLAMSLAPHIHGVLAELGTNPSIAKGASALARYGTEAFLAGKGVATANPMEILAAPTAGWTAGKGAYRLAQTAQAGARVGSNVADKIAPVLQVVGALGGAKGVLDLAKMAEPGRQDTQIYGDRVTIDPNDPRVKAQIALNRATALQWAADHPSPSIQGLKNAFADIMGAIKSHVEGSK